MTGLLCGGWWGEGEKKCKKARKKSQLANRPPVYANHNHCRSFQRHFSSRNVVGGKISGAPLYV